MTPSKLAVAGLSLALVGACGIPKEQYDRQVAQGNALHKQLKSCQTDKEGLTGKVSTLERELTALRDAMAGHKDALAAGKRSQEELERIRRKMAEEKALNDRLTASFKDMISAGQLKVVNLNGRLVIKMASKILFRPGKADLSRNGKKALERLGGILAKVDRHFQVAGHTDDRPVKRSKYDDNWELSAVRAVKVVRLLAKAGVPGKNVSAAGFAQYQPGATNRTSIGRTLNRRIEITLLPVIPSQVR